MSKPVERKPNDVPLGVKIAQEEGYDKDKPASMTNDLGQFVSANRNPMPTPNTYRAGLNQPIDTRTGKPLPENATANFSYDSPVGHEQPDQESDKMTMKPDPYDQIQPPEKPKKPQEKGQATIKTNTPPGERPEAANS